MGNGRQIARKPPLKSFDRFSYKIMVLEMHYIGGSASVVSGVLSNVKYMAESAKHEEGKLKLEMGNPRGSTKHRFSELLFHLYQITYIFCWNTVTGFVVTCNIALAIHKLLGHYISHSRVLQPHQLH